MQAVLAQMDLEDALLGIDKIPSTLTDEEKKRKDQKRLYVHHLEEGASVHEHLTVFKEILSNLEAIEVQYDKEDLGLILLCSLPPSYSTFRDTILHSRKSLTVDEVYDSLTSYDKMKYLVVKLDSQGEGLIFRGRQDRNADDDHGRTQERNPSGKSKGRSKSSNREDYSDSELLVASVNDSKVSEEWILDSGCTFHMSPNRDWFTTYETVSEGVVLTENNASCKITGVGTIKVKMFDGIVRILSDVRHVPELKRNLISLSTLDSKGYRYTAEMSDAAVASSSLSDDDITKLWHMCLGHMSENGMAKLSKRGLLDGQEICKLNFCEHCVFGKQKRVRFTRGIHNMKGTKVWAFFLKQKSDVFSFVILYSKTALQNEWTERSWRRKVVISRDIIFDETAMLTNLSLKDSSNKENQKQVEHQINTESTPQASTKIKNRVASSPQYSIAKNRTRREIKPVKKYAEADLVTYALNVAEDIYANQEPSNYFKKKRTLGVEEPRYKARLVAKVYSQVPGVDFTNVFSPVVKHSSIRALLGIVAMHDLELEQLDSPRQWYKRFDSFMTSHDFKRSSFDSCVYFKKNSDGSFVYLLLYVDDILIAAKDKGKIRKVKAQLSEEFEMKDLGPAKKILGMEILRNRKTSKLYLSQKGYIEKVLCRFNMQSAKPISTPLAAHFRLSSALSPQSDDKIEYMSHVSYSSAVGSLIYAMFGRTKDGVIGYVNANFAGDLDRRSLAGYVFTIGGCAISWKATLQTTVALSTTAAEYMAITEFGRTKDGVIGYVNANFAGDLDRRSLTGYVFTTGGCAISWKATLQTTVALSTTEAEYMAITEACKEAIWLKGLFSELNEDLQISTVFCDSQNAIFLTKDQMFHERTKHIDVWYHFVRDIIARVNIVGKKRQRVGDFSKGVSESLDFARKGDRRLMAYQNELLATTRGIVTCTIWFIWSARNKLIHENKVILPHDIICKVESYIREVDELQRKLPTRRVGNKRWRPLEFLFHKLNFDAAFNGCVNLERDLGFREVLIKRDALSVIKKMQACDIDGSLIRAYTHDAKHKLTGLVPLFAKDAAEYDRYRCRLGDTESRESVIVFSLGLLVSMDREISGFGNKDQLMLR
ncbi:hypothetical protein CXB51_026131 [Gossypium anomalum]|uniref:Retrovirus-related Pol polyprotein from transposon TNT 1-94 n=1 Tax=Gossypium anomalum TaxID=47600 RepID=A0A8J6CVD2_9ROSI|nr:hypothetical protein CXB51_026131 [Gossypium anomalum]